MLINTPLNCSDFSFAYNFWSHYQGDFVDNVKEGRGFLFFTNGEIYVGEFKNGFLEGKGCFYAINGNVFNGIWMGNKMIRSL